MKRGFLNTKKAVKSTERHTPDPPVKSQPVHAKLPIGKVEIALPKEYRGRERKYVERDPTRNDVLPDDAHVFTMVPNEKFGATVAEYPDNWTECLFLGSTPKNTILNTPNHPSRVPRPPTTRHRIEATATMGLGVFATHDLKMNDLIFAERPLVVTPVGHSLSIGVPVGTSVEQQQLVFAAMAEYEKVLDVMVRRMVPENRTALMALANSHTEDGSGPVLGILRTNGFGISFDPKGEKDRKMYSAVFNQLSRLNHSCTPNASSNFDIASFSDRLRALRDIKKDEEIFISYCNYEKPTAARQEQLKSYGFRCTCPRCMNPSSDDMRERIAQSMAPVGIPGRDHAEVLASSVGWMRTIEAAGLECLMDYEVHIIAAGRAAASLNMVNEYVRYRQMWSDWYEATHGEPPVERLL